jgi:hypothetical protein
MEESSALPLDRVSARVAQRVEKELDRYLASPEEAALAVQAARDTVPADALAGLDAVLAMKKGLSYRDGLVVQLAWGLEVEGFDHTLKGDGGRTATKAVADRLTARHIAAVRDAYQNIAKNFPRLDRGNVQAFDGLLHWMNAATAPEREQLFSLLIARIALTARNVLPMPTLARTELTFAKVAMLLDELFKTGSGGAYEQLAVAAFLEALIDEFGMGGVGALSVKTKNINAADASSGATADVQVMRGNKIEEAFEVSASDWRGKVPQALLAARNADLNRVHILAYGDDAKGLADALGDSTTDVALMDVRGFLRLIAGLLRTPSREAALRRLYELIERNQPETDRVNFYVGLLRSHSLTA